MAKCTRTACTNEGEGFVHRDIGGNYCKRCARQVNRANGTLLITKVGNPPGLINGIGYRPNQQQKRPETGTDADEYGFFRGENEISR